MNSVLERTQDPQLKDKVEAEIKHRQLQHAIYNKEGDVQSSIRQLKQLHHQKPFLSPLSYEEWIESFYQTSYPQAASLQVDSLQ